MQTMLDKYWCQNGLVFYDCKYFKTAQHVCESPTAPQGNACPLFHNCLCKTELLCKIVTLWAGAEAIWCREPSSYECIKNRQEEHISGIILYLS